MVRWKKNENQELGGKNEKRKEKNRKITLKKGEKGLKNASFWENLYVGEKN